MKRKLITIIIGIFITISFTAALISGKIIISTPTNLSKLDNVDNNSNQNLLDGNIEEEITNNISLTEKEPKSERKMTRIIESLKHLSISIKKLFQRIIDFIVKVCTTPWLNYHLLKYN